MKKVNDQIPMTFQQEVNLHEYGSIWGRRKTSEDFRRDAIRRKQVARVGQRKLAFLNQPGMRQLVQDLEEQRVAQPWNEFATSMSSALSVWGQWTPGQLAAVKKMVAKFKKSIEGKTGRWAGIQGYIYE